MSIKIGIMGYGNLGRGVECAIKQNPDMELAAVFTRRDPSQVNILTSTAKVCSVNDLKDWKDKIDVMIICGGSATDLPKQTPELAKMFNVIDSFDTHAKIPEHFANVDASAKDGKNVASCDYRPNGELASIGLVFTRPEYRRHHYAENLVYQVAKIAKEKEFLPMLYTDADYKASNACYEKIGFILRGKLCTIGNPDHYE